MILKHLTNPINILSKKSKRVCYSKKFIASVISENRFKIVVGSISFESLIENLTSIIPSVKTNRAFFKTDFSLTSSLLSNESAYPLMATTTMLRLTDPHKIFSTSG